MLTKLKSGIQNRAFYRTYLARRVLAHYCEGLLRVVRVIDGTPDYHNFMPDELSAEELAAFAPETDLETRRENAVRMTRNELTSPIRRVLHPTIEGVAFDGKTDNNLREFHFLQGVCTPLDLQVERSNYSLVWDRQQLKQPDKVADMVVDRMITDVTAFYRARMTINAALVHQQIIYSRWFRKTLLAFLQPTAVRPKLFVQANDHFPTRVAYSMVMKGLRVPRLYLQHAEVSSIFPPLDYELCVLRNKNSLDTYQSIEPIRGKVFVIGRRPVDISEFELTRPRQGPQNVVVYPTARIDTEALEEMVCALVQNTGVQSVVIKRHPRANQIFAGAFKNTDVQIVDDAPSDDHIAIVGNSSIALELVARGTPVYQSFDTDAVPRDYYGFVGSGLIPEVHRQDLGKAFWTPYRIDQEWRDTLADWLPNKTQSERDTKALRKTVKRLLSC